jgi:Fungal specific transcription factor domain
MLEFINLIMCRLDVLRGFSGPDKLAYPPQVRACVDEHSSFGHYMTFGCPPDIFRCIGRVLEAAKAELAGTLPRDRLEVVLKDAETYLRAWDPQSAVYPNSEADWPLLATAFRHACLLRIMRLPDTYLLSCEDARVRESVEAILDACAKIPSSSPCYKRMLFPLFMAGVYTNVEHQKHYIKLSIEEIRTSTGFPHYGMMKLLGQVWEEKEANTSDDRNVPWMDFVSAL